MATREEILEFDAPAKINLYLEILGRRPDGFHDLRSIVVPISIADHLTFRRTDGSITADMEFEELPGVNHTIESGQNLASRAAQLVKETAGYSGGVHIHIKKRIPICGGMGGGSVDAAVTLKAVNRLWSTGLNDKELSAIGSRLGCDIPVLVYGKPALMEGKGEKVSPLTNAIDTPLRANWWIVVVNPGFPILTKDIYSRYKSSLTCRPEIFTNILFALINGEVTQAAANLFNALQPTVFAKYPLLAMLAERMEKEGALGVLLSGSGASLFALARDEEHAGILDGRIRQAMGPWLWSRVARILPDGVMVAHSPLEARV